MDLLVSDVDSHVSLFDYDQIGTNEENTRAWSVAQKTNRITGSRRVFVDRVNAAVTGTFYGNNRGVRGLVYVEYKNQAGAYVRLTAVPVGDYEDRDAWTIITASGDAPVGFLSEFILNSEYFSREFRLVVEDHGGMNTKFQCEVAVTVFMKILYKEDP